MAERWSLWVLLPLALLVSTSAQCRIQDYQIVRLLTYKTSCQIEEIKPRTSPNGTLRFLATCANVSFYPDGIDIFCTDADDDRSCEVKTRPKSFDNLQLLTPHR